MKTAWEPTTWGELADLRYGKALKPDQRRAGPVPVYGTNGQVDWHDEALAAGPGVIIGRKGAYRGVEFSPVDFFVIDTAFWLEPKEGVEVDMRWAAYQLLDFDINNLDSGSALPSTSRGAFAAIPVDFPPLRDQQRIAHALGALDNLIENKRRRIGVLEKLARLIYREWFVYFRYPGHERVELVESRLGRIPEGWRIRSVAEIQARVPNATAAGPFGSKLGRKDYVDEPGVPVIRGSNLRIGGGFDESDMIFVSAVKGEELRTSMARPGDVVITQRGTLGQVGLIPDTANCRAYVLSQSQMKLTPNTDEASSLFVYMQLADESGTTRIQSMATGAGVPHINLTMFRELPLVVPPIELQRGFEEHAVGLYALADNLIRQSLVLEKVRDLLLPRLVSGELDISEFDLDLEAVG